MLLQYAAWVSSDAQQHNGWLHGVFRQMMQQGMVFLWVIPNSQQPKIPDSTDIFTVTVTVRTKSTKSAFVVDEESLLHSAT